MWTQLECAEGLLYLVPSGPCKLAALRCWREASAEQHLSGGHVAPRSFLSPLLALFPVRGMIAVVKGNRPRERVRAPNEQPAPFPPPPCSALVSRLLPALLSAPLSVHSSPHNQCTCGALLGAPVVCQRWTLGFRDPPPPRPMGGVSGLSSILHSMSTWKPVRLLSWQLRYGSVLVGA